MLGLLAFYTTLIPTINIVRFANSNLLPPGFDIASLTPSDVRDRTYGSKLILVVEQSQIVCVFGSKACLLLLYARLTTMRRENIAIKVLAGYVTFGFIFMEIFYFGVWCRPFRNYWAVPTPNIQCDAAIDHLITNAVFNLSSDLVMMAIGLPMFLRMQLPMRKKIPVVLIFSLGFFTIIAAILNKVYSFSQPFGSLWTYWYVRESSTALLVANLPFVWTFWRRVSGTKTVDGETVRKGSWPLEQTISAAGTAESPRRRSAQMTFAEMLQAGPPMPMGAPYTGPEEIEHVSPLTHPQLFYARQQRENLAMRDEAETDRTPVSDASPQSFGSLRSEGSFA